MWHRTFIFNHAPVYSWYPSVTAAGLYISWSLHNVVAWIKNKPFLSRKVSLIYIGTVVLVQPYWVLEMYADFTYFNNINTLFAHTRPSKALSRDPWWIFTTQPLLWNIKTNYDFTFTEIFRISTRFGVMLMAMCLSIAFLVADVCSVTGAFSSSLPIGINPFWKLSFVFGCLTYSIIFDDFKTALDRLQSFKLCSLSPFALENADSGYGGVSSSQHRQSDLTPALEEFKETSNHIENDESGKLDFELLHMIRALLDPATTVFGKIPGR